MKKLVIFLLILMLLSFQSLFAQDVGINELKRKVVEIGKLPFVNEVPLKEIDRVYLENFLESYFRKEYPEEKAEREERLLRYLGLWNSDKKLNDLRKKILFNQVVAFYDEMDSKSVYYISFKKGPLSELNSMVLAHELRHAIQDQHFNITKKLHGLSDFDDRKMAILSVIEGDANLLMLQFSGLDPSLFISFSEKIPLNTLKLTSDSENIPLILKNSLIFPYFSGLKFVYEIFTKGGWEDVNKLLLSPPSSTEQIIHPEKYIEIRDEPSELKTFYSPGSGWKLSASFVGGELFVSTFFENLNIDQNRIASEGWGNDVLNFWEKGELKFIHWSTRWDSKEDAIEFMNALTKYLQKSGFSRKEEANYYLLFSGIDENALLSFSRERIEFFKSNDKILIGKILKERKE